jgi:hypothetical protein
MIMAEGINKRVQDRTYEWTELTNGTYVKYQTATNRPTEREYQGNGNIPKRHRRWTEQSIRTFDKVMNGL